MKTLRQILKEARLAEYEGQSSGQVGSGNWSMSAADLAKSAQDPNAKAQMTKHSKTSASQLASRIGQYLTPESLVGMTQEELTDFQNRIQKMLEVALWKAKQSADKVAQEPGTNAGAKRTGTQVLNKT